MTAYIIAYSIIMFLAAATAIALCVIMLCGKKRRKDEEKANKLASEIDISDVFDKGSAAYLLLNADDGTVVHASVNIADYLSASPEEIKADTECAKKHLGKKGARAFDREYRAWLKNPSGGFAHEFEYAGGKYCEVQAFTASSNDKNYIAFVFNDITEHKNTIAKMQTELDGALEQAAAKSTFLSSMSHEIRTPMNGVMGMMALAKKNIGNQEKVASYLDRAGELSVFLLGMINDILDISKIESGKMQLFNTDLDIFAFADKIRNMFNGTVTSKGIEFEVETVDFTSRYLIGDELRLTQVVTNLVSNASKFTPAGGKISVTFKQLGNIGDNIQLMIRVRDTGKGIAPENIRKIFRPFEQEEASTAHRYGGTGLGLAICDNIVRMMGGNIVIDSTLGKGTDFSVFLSLPIADVNQDLTSAVAVEKPKTLDVEFTFEGCRILLAEDNEINAEIAVEILESEGAIVTLAHDGQEALDMFTESDENAFDLLLLDIQMPRLDGRSAAKKMRASGRGDAESVPIIALSADAFVEDVKLSEAAGMDGHVSKPVDFDELRRRAGEIIAAKRSQ